MPTDAVLPALRTAPPSPVKALWHSFRENRGAVFGLAVVSLIVLVAIFADWIAPHSPIEQFRDYVRLPPIWDQDGDWNFVLGTDAVGRDMLSRIIHGARISLFIGLSVVATGPTRTEASNIALICAIVALIGLTCSAR